MRGSWTTALAGLALLVGGSAGVAHAGEIPEPAPPSAVVAPAADGLPALVASVRGTRVCLEGQLDDGFAEDERCGDPAARDDDAAVAVSLGGGSGATALVGAVPAAGASVRVAFPGGQRVVVPTVPSPASLAPAGSRFAFFRVPVPQGARPPGTDERLPVAPVWLQVLDASGAVIGVRAGLDTVGSAAGARVGPTRVRVLARRGGVSARAVSYTQEVLAPTTARADRTVLQACLGVVARRGSALSGGGGERCTGPDEPTALATASGDVLATVRCEARAVAVEGVLPAGTTAARAVLGSGRRVPVALLDLAPALPGRVGVAYVPPLGEAVRRLELTGPRATAELGAAPAAVSCPPRIVGDDTANVLGLLTVVPRSVGTPVALASPPAILAGTGPTALVGAEGPAGTLCLAVGRTALQGVDCAPLARAPGAVLVAASAPASRPHVVAGVTGSRGATVTVSLSRFGTSQVRTRRVTVPTSPVAAGAGGAYAGRLRAFALPARADEAIGALVVRSASGARLDPDQPGDLGGDQQVVGPDPDEEPGALPATRLGRIGGLTAWRVVLRIDGDAIRCGLLTAGPRPARVDVGQCTTTRSAAQVRVEATCAPRRLALFVVTGRRGARLSVTGRDGRPVAVRRFGLGGGVSLQVARPAAAQGLGRVALRGVGRSAASVPSAREQCGYVTAVPLAGS